MKEGIPLNLEMIAETVQKYWVQQVCVLVVAVITWWYRRQTKKLKEIASDDKAVRMAMVAQLRDRFYQGYQQYVQQGYFPIRDREVMQDIYAQYHALGGNGVITHLMEELEKMPTYLDGID